MTEAEAETHLRAIRLMMERATVYRAISAPIALLGGLLSTATAAIQLLLLRNGKGVEALGFYFSWMCVLALTALANVFFIWRGARLRGEPVGSPAMGLALRSLVPSFLAGTVTSFCITLTSGQPVLAVIFWQIFYGIGLLATMNFAPGSLLALGWAFLLTGLVAMVYFFYRTLLPDMGLPMPGRESAPLLMGATFGLYHLIYAACVWPRQSQVLDAIERRPLVHH